MLLNILEISRRKQGYLKLKWKSQHMCYAVYFQVFGTIYSIKLGFELATIKKGFGCF